MANCKVVSSPVYVLNLNVREAALIKVLVQNASDSEYAAGIFDALPTFTQLDIVIRELREIGYEIVPTSMGEVKDG